MHVYWMGLPKRFYMKHYTQHCIQFVKRVCPAEVLLAVSCQKQPTVETTEL